MALRRHTQKSLPRLADLLRDHARAGRIRVCVGGARNWVPVAVAIECKRALQNILEKSRFCWPGTKGWFKRARREVLLNWGGQRLGGKRARSGLRKRAQRYGGAPKPALNGLEPSSSSPEPAFGGSKPALGGQKAPPRAGPALPRAFERALDGEKALPRAEPALPRTLASAVGGEKAPPRAKRALPRTPEPALGHPKPAHGREKRPPNAEAALPRALEPALGDEKAPPRAGPALGGSKPGDAQRMVAPSLTIAKRVGTGTCGSVFRANWRGKRVAVKGAVQGKR